MARSSGNSAPAHAAALGLGVLVAVLAACHHRAQADCSNGMCGCPRGETCDFSCDSPPCSIECLPGSRCTAECADGACSCEDGALCNFSCRSGPCHVTCAGSNPICAGECWDGQCSCGPGSTCAFVCDSPPCHTTCDPGSSCTVACVAGGAGGSCDIVACGTGKAVTCPDGVTLACNAPCPR